MEVINGRVNIYFVMNILIILEEKSDATTKVYHYSLYTKLKSIINLGKVKIKQRYDLYV